jgi:FG-GAP repeat
LQSAAGFAAVQFGLADDKPVVGDYDGDGKSDIAVFRPSNGYWYILGSNAGFMSFQWGISTDILVPADYDGDGKTDFGVYRNGNWYLLRSTLWYAEGRLGDANSIPVTGAFVP